MSSYLGRQNCDFGILWFLNLFLVYLKKSIFYCLRQIPFVGFQYIYIYIFNIYGEISISSHVLDVLE